ncbi:hypothetical protein LCGC14_2225790 [marine sediment metagenome]|uniref:HNH nuclease domain-containing protein n=1 Tax=marine sediment metagenome TaxID=412755 RepID=A0A0F9FM90_9ZZZZ
MRLIVLGWDDADWDDDTEDRMVQLVHRVVWRLSFGPIPDGVLVLHTCHIPPCIEITHLYLGDHSTNMEDMTRAGNHRNSMKTHCPQGHPYDEANTYTRAGYRYCRTCQSENHSKYIQIPTPEEIAQARAASLDPSNPRSFAALTNEAVARRRNVESRLATAAGVPLHVWLSPDFNSDSGAKEVKARATELGVWEHHIAETGIHPLPDGQTCSCPARHIPETSTPYQIPETTEKD